MSLGFFLFCDKRRGICLPNLERVVLLGKVRVRERLEHGSGQRAAHGLRADEPNVQARHGHRISLRVVGGGGAEKERERDTIVEKGALSAHRPVIDQSLRHVFPRAKTRLDIHEQAGIAHGLLEDLSHVDLARAERLVAADRVVAVALAALDGYAQLVVLALEKVGILQR